MLFLLRYGEIGLKSNQIKRKFENRLVENIKNHLNNFDIQITKGFSRIFINSKKEEKQILKKLKFIPGIVSVSPVLKTDLEMQNIFSKCQKILKDKKIKKFALKIRRAGNHEFTSQEIAVKLGDLIREKYNLKVDLDNPDLKICVEIRNKNSYIYTKKIKGFGGIPLGIEGKVLSFIKNKFDAYAAISMMKRGCKIFPINFGKISKKHIENLELLKNFDQDLKVLEIKKENLEETAKFFKIKALVSGLTADELTKISDIKNSETSQTPVLFPNSGFGKQEIQEKIKHIKRELKKDLYSFF